MRGGNHTKGAEKLRASGEHIQLLQNCVVLLRRAIPYERAFPFLPSRDGQGAPWAKPHFDAHRFSPGDMLGTDDASIQDTHHPPAIPVILDTHHFSPPENEVPQFRTPIILLQSP